MTTELLDLETMYLVKKAAPVVAAVPFDVADLVVIVLDGFSQATPPHTDIAGYAYWEASLAELIEACQLEISPATLGRVLRALGLTLWRKSDGYHVAWSKPQLAILLRYFKKDPVTS